MTEAEWLACEDPPRMLRLLGERLSARKLRLFLCGGCRRVWPSLALPPVRRAVEAAERFADGEIGGPELAAARDAALSAVAQYGRRSFHKLTTDPASALKAFKLAVATNA